MDKSGNIYRRQHILIYFGVVLFRILSILDLFLFHIYRDSYCYVKSNQFLEFVGFNVFFHYGNRLYVLVYGSLDSAHLS